MLRAIRNVVQEARPGPQQDGGEGSQTQAGGVQGEGPTGPAPHVLPAIDGIFTEGDISGQGVPSEGVAVPATPAATGDNLQDGGATAGLGQQGSQTLPETAPAPPSGDARGESYGDVTNEFVDFLGGEAALSQVGPVTMQDFEEVLAEEVVSTSQEGTEQGGSRDSTQVESDPSGQTQ